MTYGKGASPTSVHRIPGNVDNGTRILEELRQFKRRHRLLDEKRDELVTRYPDQWVALTPNGTIVAGGSIGQVIEKLDQKGLSRKGTAIKFMATRPRRMIV